MKKNIGIIGIVAIILISVFALTSCGGDDAPEGMQLVKGGENLGYYFYAPEEWVVANHGDIACTYASSVDNTSVTFAQSELPDVSIAEYFAGEKAKFPFDITVSVDGEKCNFGNAENAYRYVYSYEYKGKGFCTMQIFILNENNFYIFTFNSYTEKRSDDESYYQFYLEKVESIINNFKFVEKKVSDLPPHEYERDEDGHILVSDKQISGFELYVPDSYKVDYSSGIVSVTKDDGTNINLTKATYTGVSRETYWNTRVENLGYIVDRQIDENTGKPKTETVTKDDGSTYEKELTTLEVIEKDKQVNLDGCDWAFSYEYTYKLNGKSFHIYQVLVVDGYDGFVFTYTADEANYDAHISEALAILAKVKF